MKIKLQVTVEELLQLRHHLREATIHLHHHAREHITVLQAVVIVQVQPVQVVQLHQAAQELQGHPEDNYESGEIYNNVVDDFNIFVCAE